MSAWWKGDRKGWLRCERRGRVTGGGIGYEEGRRIADYPSVWTVLDTYLIEKKEVIINSESKCRGYTR